MMSFFNRVAVGATIISQLCAPLVQAVPIAAEMFSCKVQTGVTPPLFDPDLFNPSAKDVTDSVTAWLNDVCTVDSFLNNPKGKTSLATTIAFAIDEPVQLKTLSSLPMLSNAGKNAAAVLEANFPSVPANLYNLQDGKTTAEEATTAINFMRCCTVLPAIKILVKEASIASGAFDKGAAAPSPVFPSPCAAFKCKAGASKS